MIKWEDVISIDNIIKSFKQCLRGKYKKEKALIVFKYLENNILELFDNLKTGNYKHSGYNFFTNYDSKKRVIATAHLIDKIVHRMLYNKLNDEFDKNYIFDSYACRCGKGAIRAIKRCQKFLRNKKLIYFLKSDIKKYFDNIDHIVLKRILVGKIKDQNILNLLNVIIDSYCIVPNKGIPIGNLTSQMFANLYLNYLDKFVKHELKVKYYIRYMDDFIILTDNISDLKLYFEKIKEFLYLNLKLEISNKNTIFSKIDNGVVFLGKRIFWNKEFLLNKTKKRIRYKMNWLKIQGKLDDLMYLDVLYSYFNYVRRLNYVKFNFYIRKKISNCYKCKLREIRAKII